MQCGLVSTVRFKKLEASVIAFLFPKLKREKISSFRNLSLRYLDVWRATGTEPIAIELALNALNISPASGMLPRPSLQLSPVSAHSDLAQPTGLVGLVAGVHGHIAGVAYNLVPENIEAMEHMVPRLPLLLVRVISDQGPVQHFLQDWLA